ncbi:GntR family transcriptional regulator [Alteribacillus sp. HJP-4]|uniref:GntR family transcriptional regulator n=1 Tax=Alteribacillus sp. HJP-4 TaxID=2775394 RepID=UPI0035CCFFD2
MQTKYNRVKQAIKSKILDGTFRPHQKIGSENDLMKQFDVSRHTVRLAVGELVSQGWLYKEQGAGTFCADRSTVQKGIDQGSSKNIAIITTYISNYIFPSIIRGAESYLSNQNFHVTLLSTNNNHMNEKHFLERIISQNFDGVIIEPTRSAVSNPNINYYLNLERLGIPYLMINAYYEELEPLYIAMDDEKGGFMQTDHLLKAGHRNIGGFFKTDDLQGIKRMKGYVKAHRANKVPMEPNNIITYNTEEKRTKPLEELKRLLSSSSSMPTGIVCYNDELVVRLLDVLRERDLQIPSDLSIVGFDDSFLARASEVKLTTIKHPKSKLGETAGKLMLDMIKRSSGTQRNKMPELEPIIFEPELVERNSTRPLNNSILNKVSK